MTNFSLIVATIGRTDQLGNLLQSLTQQTVRDFEVIIVDQNPEGFLADILAHYSPLMKITHLRSNRPGASRARNIGIDRAVGKIITFPDDDCELPPDLLKSIGEIFRRSPALAGLTISSRDKHFRGSIGRFATRGGTITKFNILKRCIEAGIFLRRESLDGHRFDESMGVGAETPWWSDEGPDLLLAVMSDGGRIEFYPEIVIFHPDPVREYDKKAIVRSMKYGRGRGHYLRKHAYPFWFVLYVWGLYVVGVFWGIAQLNLGKTKYYLNGLRGRIQGYLDGLERPVPG